MATRVKICGITRVEDVLAAIEFGADFIGLNFYEKTPRYIAPDAARAVREAIGDRARVVGVFVDAPREYVEECRRTFALDLLQFSGNESAEALRGWPVPVIRVMHIRAEQRIDLATESADYFMFDAFDTALYGGTGKRIALERLKGFDLSRAFIAGGLNAANVAEVVALHPYAVDCASGVESAPGIKDHDKMRSFIANAKSTR
jgi:phosphoribosylanthranilate isomerase